MKDYVYYIILKSYKGLIKKSHIGNTHLFFIPIGSGETLYLALIGKLESSNNIYMCQLINRIPNHLRPKIVEEQKLEFKDRYVVLSILNCIPKQTGDEQFEIDIPTKGKYIHSDLKLSFDPDYSSDRQRIYRLEGKINLETSEVSGEFNIKSVGIKKLALVGGKI